MGRAGSAGRVLSVGADAVFRLEDQMEVAWSPREDADPPYRWLRAVLHAAVREGGLRAPHGAPVG